MGFVLPVCTPIGPLTDRLLGWLIAPAIRVPSALFVCCHHGGTTANCASTRRT